MTEILALACFVLALAAFLNARKTAERLADEISALKERLTRIEAMPVPVPAGEAGQEPILAETASLVPEQDVSAAGTVVTAGDVVNKDAVFGAASRQTQDAVEKAARGEPVAARAPVSTIDAVVPRPKESLESRLGARWAVWVGGIALALGGVFMVKYSIDAGLLSPAVRLVMAAIFGLVLIGAAEMIRRRGVPRIADTFRNAMIPGVLTAAGAVSLFGACFVAHDIYGYIGTVAAFFLLALISLATVGLSLLHGQALAGLGLLASLLTPLLMSAESPKPWSLFTFLIVAWTATLLAARFRRWTVVPALANIGLFLWALAYIGWATPFETLPVSLTMVAMIAGIGLIWPGNGGAEAPVVATEIDALSTAVPEAMPSEWKKMMVPPQAAITVTGAIAASLTALTMINPMLVPSGHPVVSFAIIICLLAALGAVRTYAVYPALLAAVVAFIGVSHLTSMSLLGVAGPLDAGDAVPDAVWARPAMITAMALSVAFPLLGVAALVLHRKTKPQLAKIWSAIMALMPVALVGISFVMTGNLSFDAAHGLFALVVGASLLAMTECLSRRDAAADTVFAPQSFLVAGSFGLFVICLHAMTDGLVTTLAIAVLGALHVAATRRRSWPILPWMMVAAAIAVLARIAWEPTIVGPLSLGRTPVFNALLPGYGLPALLLVLAAYELRNWPGLRVRNLLQALASLFALLTVAILVRHAMNGGVLDSSVPTLGEQSIYTLLAIGASAILMTLDLKSPSPVFRYGGMAVGVLSILSILGAHLIGLNPYFSGELLGSVPFFDLLLIGYLLPGLGYTGLASYARGKRPAWYVTVLAVAGAVLAFVWATLSVRRFWQGQNIADWKGFLPGETYTYSVVWLILGVALLALGSRFNAKSIRIASAVLVFVAVLKVFLVDMANLEGFLRALSFIGLGAVLIGIGLFYQRLLSGSAGRPALTAPPEDPAGKAAATL